MECFATLVWTARLTASVADQGAAGLVPRGAPAPAFFRAEALSIWPIAWPNCQTARPPNRPRPASSLAPAPGTPGRARYAKASTLLPPCCRCALLRTAPPSPGAPALPWTGRGPRPPSRQIKGSGDSRPAESDAGALASPRRWHSLDTRALCFSPTPTRLDGDPPWPIPRPFPHRGRRRHPDRRGVVRGSRHPRWRPRRHRRRCVAGGVPTKGVAAGAAAARPHRGRRCRYHRRRRQRRATRGARPTRPCGARGWPRPPRWSASARPTEGWQGHQPRGRARAPSASARGSPWGAALGTTGELGGDTKGDGGSAGRSDLEGEGTDR